MIITHRTKQDFDSWFINVWCVEMQEREDMSLFQTNDILQWFYESDPVLQYAYISEWFDSIGLWKDAFYEVDGEILDGNNASWNYTLKTTIEKLNIDYNLGLR